MKASNDFEKAIKSFLNEEKKTDTALELALTKEGKTLSDCCSYIMKKVQSMKVNALADNEVFAMAKEYYMNEKLTSVKKPNGKVVVAGPTDSISKSIPEVETKSKPKAVKEVHPNQMSIFDLIENEA